MRYLPGQFASGADNQPQNTTVSPGASCSAAAVEVCRVHAQEPFLSRRDVVVGEDRRDWTRGNTCRAVDALCCLDEELVGRIIRVDAVDRAYLDTGSILGADARLSD